MQIVGLDICADILVGNEMVRGISGGQKKRVTTSMVFFLSHYCDAFMVPIPSLFVSTYGMVQISLSSCLIVLILC